MTGKNLLIGAGLLSLVAAAVAAWCYNDLVAKEEGVASGWSQVENVYQRRADLIPNLIETVKAASDFEQETLQRVVDARNRLGGLQLDGLPTEEELQRFQAAQDQLGASLDRLMVVVEDYPELKATEAYRDLMHQLEGTENRIAVERRRYNEGARAYNTARRSFPTMWISAVLNFEAVPYFKADPQADQAPKVDF